MINPVLPGNLFSSRSFHDDAACSAPFLATISRLDAVACVTPILAVKARSQNLPGPHSSSRLAMWAGAKKKVGEGRFQEKLAIK